MKFIETVFSYDEGMSKECKRNGIIKQSRHTINVQHIVSYTEWVGKLIHEGKTGTQIIDINGNKYIDERSYNDFIKYLSITKPFV